MLITMEKDIISTFDVVSVERSGLHALLAGKVSNDEGDHLYSACEQAQTLLLTEGLTPRVWKSLSALRNTLLTVVETKLGTHHRLCCILRDSEIDRELAGRLESLREITCVGSGAGQTQLDRLLIDLFDSAIACVQDLHPRLLGPSHHMLV